MKKLLSLAIGLFLANAHMNAQNCNFTFIPDSITGTYTFIGPAGFDSTQNSFLWSFENGSVYSSEFYATHTYQTSRVDLVTLRVYGADSSLVCMYSDTIDVYVVQDSIPTNTCPISYSTDVNNPNMYTFYIPGSNYPASWDFGDSTTAFGYTITHVFTSPGYYSICANINDSSYTCSSCTSIYISDSSYFPTCRADFYVSASPLVGYFIPTGNYNTSNIDYSWDFGDGGTSAEAYPYHEYTMTGLYNVCLTVSEDTCSNTQCQQVFIPSSNPIPQDSCFAGFILSQENPFEISVVNITSGDNLDFIWTLTSQDGTTAGSGTGAYPVITVDTTGAFILCLTITNNTGCSASFCDSLYIGPNGMIGGKVSATGFTIRVVSPQTMTGYVAGIDDVRESGFSIYPNPFSDVLTVTSERNTLSSFELYAVDGKKVEQGNFNSNTQTINTSNLHKGIYILKVIDVKGISKVLKLVKN